MTKGNDIEQLETLRRKKRAYQARIYESKSLAAIGDELGVSPSTVLAWVREIKQIVLLPEEENELREIEVARLDKDEADARLAESYLLSEGLRREQAGLSNVDVMEALRRWKATILDIRKQRAQLLGLNKPVAVRHTHVVRTEFDEEIEELVSALSGGGFIMTDPDEVWVEDDAASQGK